MSYHVALRREDFGKGPLRAETHIPLGFDRRELRISTGKSSRGGLSCTANVVQVDEDGRTIRFVVFGDYSKQLARDNAMRCTEKNLLAMHSSALSYIDGVIAEVRAFYKVDEKAAA